MVTRKITIITRPDGLTQADVDANLETIGHNILLLALDRADAAGMSLTDYLERVFLPALPEDTRDRVRLLLREAAKIALANGATFRKF